MAAKPIPDNYRSVTPYLIVEDASRALEFYQQAFGAQERMRLPSPDGKVMHAEIDLGDSVIMLADEFPDRGIRGPKSFGGSPVSLVLYVEDVDAVFRQAVAAGAKATREVMDQFYGDRSGMLEDPFGHAWSIATHKEDLTPDEISRRFQELMKQQAG